MSVSDVAIERARKRVTGKAHGYVTLAIGDVRAILAAIDHITEEKREEPSEAWPAGMRRVVHELRLSAQVFRDYERQHEDKALEAPRAREAEERRRKAKRNGDRAAACEEALAALGEPHAMRAATSSDRSE